MCISVCFITIARSEIATEKLLCNYSNQKHKDLK